MQIDLPEEIPAAKTSETDVYANIFAGSQKSTVEMRVGSTGEWQAMTHVGEVDPTFVRTAAHEEAILAAKPNDFRKLPKRGSARICGSSSCPPCSRGYMTLKSVRRPIRTSRVRPSGSTRRTVAVSARQKRS